MCMIDIVGVSKGCHAQPRTRFQQNILLEVKLVYMRRMLKIEVTDKLSFLSGQAKAVKVRRSPIY